MSEDSRRSIKERQINVLGLKQQAEFRTPENDTFDALSLKTPDEIKTLVSRVIAYLAEAKLFINDGVNGGSADSIRYTDLDAEVIPHIVGNARG